jgi:Cd2+/Zn2+-exporting ATPase
MEFRSEHPLANAILAEAARRGIDYADVTVERFEALPGRGIRATIGGTAYHLGNRRMSEDYGFWSNAVDQLDRRLAAEGKTAVILGSPGEAIAVLAMRDTARTQSGEAVAAIRRCGIEHVVMLSGDHPAAAQRVAHELGITEVRAALLPEHKVNAIRDLQQEYGSVAMVGDGMNDAPALAAASAGIAMGVSGTDASLETADVVLMSDELGKLPHLLLLSQKAMAIIRQNIALALGIKVLFLALSVAGISTLWMALLADDGAALAVIANGLRILSFKGAR